VALDVVVVERVVHDQLVHQREGQRGVGAGQQRDVLVALVGGLGAARVDAHQLRAGALGGLRVAPEMQVAADRVAAPDQDQPRLGEVLDAHADLAAEGHRQAFGAGRGADGAIELRGAQPVEETPVHRLALHQAHGAGIAVGQDGLGASRARRHDAQARGDVVERLVPAHGLEAALALGADAAQRLQQALRVRAALQVARHLGAQHAPGVRMRRVALQARGDAVLHRRHERAGVGAVVRTGAEHGGGGGGGGRAGRGGQGIGHRASLSSIGPSGARRMPG
jgi:hypothetical protein